MLSYREYGCSPSESELLASLDWESKDEYIDEYVEARRQEFYTEFYQYLKENDINPFNL